MKDFEQILQQKKGKGYEKWAMHFNNSQAAEVLIFLQEKNIDSYEKLDALTENATDRFHVLSEEIKTCEAKLKELGALKKAIVDYSKTRSTCEAYRKTGYSKKFLEARREEITIHRAAKKTFDAYPSQKIPKVKELSEEYTEVLNWKKAAYKEYRTVKKDMQQYTIARKNVEMLLGRGKVVLFSSLVAIPFKKRSYKTEINLVVQRHSVMGRGHQISDPLLMDKGCRFNLHPFRCSGVFTG